MEFQNWTYKDFIENDIKKVEAYSYQIKKNGKVSKDSLLIYRQEIDRDSNKVSGINSRRVFQSHGPSYLTGYSFQTYYDKNGLVIKNIESPNGTGKKTQFDLLQYDQDISTYKYDSLGKLTYECNKNFYNNYSIYNHSKNTFHSYSARTRIYEYNYNDKGQKSSRYYTDDGLKSLNCDWTYYENGNLKTWISYTDNGKVHSKKYYYYDKTDRLIKQVDSTGWYFETILPYWESTTTYEYSDTGKVVTRINNTQALFGSDTKEEITKYDAKGCVTCECSIYDSTETCTNYSYTFDKDKLASAISIYSNNSKMETYFLYNLQGLLFEKKVIYNNKITQLTRYYYE